MVRVCFVCLGNICRSPTAEGIMIQLVKEAGVSASVGVDSAGTGAWHAGESADKRARATARERGFELPSVARQFLVSDFDEFEYVIAMDRSNYRNLSELAPTPAAGQKVRLLRSFDSESPEGAEVPDPYYGGPDGFENVFDICDAGCRGLLAHIRDHHL